MSLISLISSDLRAKSQWLYGDTSGRSIVKTCCTDGTFAMIVYRLMQASRRARLSPLAMLFNKLNILVGGCIIGRGAEIGPEMVFIHSQGIVINSAVIIGRGLRIEHQVTIGAERGEIPLLGDNVFLGAGAKVVGGVRIGSNVKIGANAVVVGDIPDNVTAVGIPARVVVR